MKDVTKNLFRSSTAARIMGKSPAIRFTGDPIKRRVYEEAIAASHNLYNTLQCESADAVLISDALYNKRTAASEFKRIFGFAWPF